MLKRIDKRRTLKEIFICLFVVFISVSLSNVRIFYNNFVFIVPFVIFCFMNNKWYGYLSFLSSLFVVGGYNKWFYLSYLIVISSLLLLKYLINKDTAKFKNIISFYSFFMVIIQGIVSLIVYDLNNYFIIFLLGVISYWVMRYFYELYINMNINEKRYLTPFLLVFILSMVGISFIGLYKEINYFNLSVIVIVLLGFIGSKVSLEVGVLYSFIIILLFKALNVNIDIMLFLTSSAVVFLLSKTSKITLLFTYALIVVLYLHYSEIDYFLGVNYIIGAVSYIFIPNVVFKYLSENCYGSDQYIERITKDNKRFNLEISNKILKMEEVFSLVTSKFNIAGRLRKCEKELLLEEILMFDDLFKKFAKDIKDKYEFNYYSNIEKNIYRYGYDLLYLEVKEDIFKDLVIDINIRCSKNDIYKVIKPLISKAIKKNLKIHKIKQNDVFDYYEVQLKEEIDYKFNYAIKQIAKDKEVCGDSYLICENDNKIIYALSDGMGVGKEAKEKSKLALDMFKKFIDIGFEEGKAINSINCLLKSEYNKDSYATLDLFIYDKYTKEFSFYKNGACDSYIIRNKELINIEGDKLPVGIMDKIEVSKKCVEIHKGDYLIMVSDGVSERQIKDIKSSDPVRMSNEILNNNEIYDDQSVIVINIK